MSTFRVRFDPPYEGETGGPGGTVRSASTETLREILRSADDYLPWLDIGQAPLIVEISLVADPAEPMGSVERSP